MSRPRDDSALGSLAVIVVAGAAGFTVVAVNLGPAFAIPVGIIAFIAATVVLRGPLGQALARRIEGRSESSDDDRVVRALDEIRAELAELGERVDFAERLLAQQGEQERLQRGASGGR
jgi:hypothetical protein